MRASSVAAIAAAQAGNPGAQVQVQMMHPPDAQVPEAGVQGRASCLFGRVSGDRRAWGGFHFLDQLIASRVSWVTLGNEAACSDLEGALGRPSLD